LALIRNGVFVSSETNGSASSAMSKSSAAVSTTSSSANNNSKTASKNSTMPSGVSNASTTLISPLLDVTKVNIYDVYICR
jgi:hypothetical protein